MGRRFAPKKSRVTDILLSYFVLLLLHANIALLLLPKVGGELPYSYFRAARVDLLLLVG